MWIIPKNLPTYHSVLATKGLVEDCEEFSRMSERSLTAKSKFTQWQTWSRRWKRVTYIQRLSTRTLKPSHIKNFVAKWTSYQRDSLASHSAPLVAEAPQKILDTFTPLSQEESQSADQLMLFSKMSKGLSQAKQPMGSRYSSMSSEIWKKEVTRLRGEYSLRLKLALHTSGRECLSWPTAKLSDGEGGRINTILTEGGFKSLRKKSNQYFGAKLRDAVETYEEKNWPTPAGRDYKGGHGTIKETERGYARVSNKTGTKFGARLDAVVEYENEKNWPTPRAGNPGSRKPGTGGKVLGEEVKNWRTPTQMDAQNKDRFNYALRLLSGKVIRHSGESVQITLGDHVTMEELRNHPDLDILIQNISIMKQRTRLPEQKEFVDYLRGQTSIKELDDKTDIKKSTIEHWFRYDTSGFSYPSIEDWYTIKPFLSDIRFNDELIYEEVIEWKPKRMMDGLQDQGKSNTSGKSQESWTTPCSDDTGYRKKRYKQGGTALSNQSSGKLNPNWVEQIMGLPVGWTQLPIEWTD